MPINDPRPNWSPRMTILLVVMAIMIVVLVLDLGYVESLVAKVMIAIGSAGSAIVSGTTLVRLRARG